MFLYQHAPKGFTTYTSLSYTDPMNPFGVTVRYYVLSWLFTNTESDGGKMHTYHEYKHNGSQIDDKKEAYDHGKW